MANDFVRHLLGFPSDASDEDVENKWRRRTAHVCKPCWELKYCPYGILVEEFPTCPVTRREEDYEQHSRTAMEINISNDGSRLDNEKKLFFEEAQADGHSSCSESLDCTGIEKCCAIYGHVCPVFFVNEPFTETKTTRRVSRSIKPRTMIRIARRDNYLCQKCGNGPLHENDIEFDHIIPYSFGGSSDEDNIQILCAECNRSKLADVSDMLSEHAYGALQVNLLNALSSRSRRRKKAKK